MNPVLVALLSSVKEQNKNIFLEILDHIQEKYFDKAKILIPFCVLICYHCNNNEIVFSSGELVELLDKFLEPFYKAMEYLPETPVGPLRVDPLAELMSYLGQKFIELISAKT